MPGWTTNGDTNGSIYTGGERASFDTNYANGVSPQTISIGLQKLATLGLYYGNTKDKTTVNGTRFYTSFTVGEPNVLTGVQVLVGSTGGTDLWLAELHDSTGVLVATSATSGTTAGTAAGWQQLAFTSAYTAAAGSYYIAVQSNGTTAKLATYNSPQSPLFTGSATGTFGTGASITPPTTYTANLGPVVLLY